MQYNSTFYADSLYFAWFNRNSLLFIMLKHYLNIADYTAADYEQILARAAAVKAEVAAGSRAPRLAGRTLLMLFEKPSTRTRTSFAVAMAQAGGSAIELSGQALHIGGGGETLEDTARALSGYGDALMMRVLRHQTIEAFAAVSSCPVINGLSDLSHPCQVLADVMTFQELRGELRGQVVAWIGDCNNVLYSWAQAAGMFGCRLRVACPPAYRQELAGVEFCETPAEAAAGAALVMTDVWVSMGNEDGAARRQAFEAYRVDAAVMAAARSDALFMHCLPARRGEEVAAEVIDGPRSAVWQQAENRLHAQKGLLLFLLEE